MLATFTPERIAAPLRSLARCAPPVGEAARTQCSRYTPSASLLPVTNSLSAGRAAGIPSRCRTAGPSPARGLVMGVVLAVLVAAAGVVEVREVELVDALVLDQLQQAGRSWALSWVMVKRTPTLRPSVAAQADAVQRRVEGAFLAAEAVVGLADAVEADADVVESRLGDAVDVGFVDQRAVGRQADVEAHGLGAAGDVEDVRPQQRLAAGEDQHRHAEGLEVVHHAEDFLGRQLAGEILVGGNRVAVLAGQVAAPDQVPDHHRAGRIALRAERRGVAFRCMYWVMRNIRSASESASPVFLRMRVLYRMSWARQAVAQQGAIGPPGPRPRRGSGRAPWRTGCRASRQMARAAVAVGDEGQRADAPRPGRRRCASSTSHTLMPLAV
jgi:hypothetical protein